MFFKEFSSAPSLHLFDQKYSKISVKYSEIFLQLKITDFYLNIYKKNIPVIKTKNSSVSHDPSKIILIC